MGGSSSGSSGQGRRVLPASGQFVGLPVMVAVVAVAVAVVVVVVVVANPR